MFVHLSNYLCSKADFSPADLKVVEAQCIYLNLKTGEKLLTEGIVWKYHAFMCKGLVRGYKPDFSGNIQTVLFAPENYWTGDRESLLTATPSSLEIIAETDCEIILIPHEAYNALCVTLAPFAEFMSTLVQRNLEFRRSKIMDHVISDEEKLNNFLTKFSTVPGRTAPENIASFLEMEVNALQTLMQSKS